MRVSRLRALQIPSPTPRQTTNPSSHFSPATTTANLRSDRLRLLTGIIPMLLLHLLDQGDVFLLSVGGADAFVDDLFPGFVFVFALYWVGELVVGVVVGLEDEVGMHVHTLKSNVPGLSADSKVGFWVACL
jgi:hypothetical protein